MTLIHEDAAGRKIEFRRVRRPGRDGILDLEHRVLRPDGTPHPDGWYPVDAAMLLWLQRAGSDIVTLLAGE
jgi:PAS domain-containing protein